MRKILKNWNFKKHLALVTSFYTAIFTAANFLMVAANCKKSQKEVKKGAKWLKYISPEEKKRAIAKSYVREPSKVTKIANGVIGICFLVDLASYPLIKKMTKKL